MKITRQDNTSGVSASAETAKKAAPLTVRTKGFTSNDAVAKAARRNDFMPKDTRRASPAEMHEAMSLLALRVANADGSDAPSIDPRYFDVTRAVARIDEMVAKYPTIATKVDLSALPGAAKTHEGRSIFALKLSGKPVAGGKPAVVIVAQHHARELNAGFIAQAAMERIASGYGKDAALTKLLDEREVYIVPIVNPDGVNTVFTEERMWRKNKAKNSDGSRGVDINRNYPFLFGACGTSEQGSSEVYKGPSAASEPEVRTMMAVQRELRPELYIDFHNHGNEVLELYPPCADVSSAMKAMDQHYIDRLAKPMGFHSRAPSGSGEAPHWHWSEGTLSYLIEVGSAFQPRVEETIEDEKKVWQGLSAALTTWAPAARGRITSADGTPIHAKLTVKQPLFNHGEHSASRASDGRFSLWLPKGTWDVEVTAKGHAPKVVQVKVDAYDQAMTLDVKLDRATDMVA